MPKPLPLTEFDTSLNGLPDAELLELYVSAGQTEAIDVLITRYSAMVATVCRLTVADPQAAEDAFQATFLVLVQSARKIRSRNSVAAWLHGVAYRTACRIRKKHHLAGLDEREIVESSQSQTLDPVEALARQIDLETLNQELERLPEKLRSPLVEHYLLGHTASSIADRMELSTSAVEGRLRRGRRALRQRLACRGISMSIVVSGSLYLQKNVIASDTAAWTEKLIEHIHGPELGGASDPGAFEPVNPEVSSLIAKEVSMVGSSSLKVASALLAVAAGTVLTGWVAQSLAIDDGGRSRTGGRNQGAVAKLDAPQEPANTTLVTPGGLPDLSPGGSVAGQVGFAQPAPAQGAAAPAAPAAPLQDVATGGQGGVAAGGMTAAKAVPWQRPGGEGDTGLPAWLQAGQQEIAAVEALRGRLGEPVVLHAVDQPLSSVLASIASDIELPIWLNLEELSVVGVDADQPITMDIPGKLPLRSALELMLKPLDLTYVIRDSVIEITSQDAADADPITRYYDLSYILPNSANADALVNAIQTSIDPDSWMLAGGHSTVSLVGSMMIVAAPESTQLRIEKLLINVARMNPANASQPVGLQVMGGGMGGMGGGMGGMGGGMGGGMF